jgi:phage pi2 protein 07
MQCFKQKETILKLGNLLKNKSKFTKSKIGWVFYPEPTAWFCIFSGQRQMSKFGRNKLDHSEKKYGLPL